MPLTLTAMRARATRHERRRGWPRTYPTHPMVDFGFKARRAVRAALATFKAARPFRLEGGEAYVALVRQLYTDLSAAYDVPAPTVTHEGPWTGDSGASSYDAESHAVTLRGKGSVLTALHEYVHARGYGETAAVWWSVNAFRLTWPKSFAKLRPQAGSHFLTPGASRTPAQADAWWRSFYQERERQERALRQCQERERQAEQARLRVRTNLPPPGASATLTRRWRYMAREARATVWARHDEQQAREAAARRAEAEAEAARIAASSPNAEASIERFQNLDLSDAPENTPPPADADVSDGRITRFQLLQLD